MRLRVEGQGGNLRSLRWSEIVVRWQPAERACLGRDRLESMKEQRCYCYKRFLARILFVSDSRRLFREFKYVFSCKELKKVAFD